MQTTQAQSHSQPQLSHALIWLGLAALCWRVLGNNQSLYIGANISWLVRLAGAVCLFIGGYTLFLAGQRWFANRHLQVSIGGLATLLLFAVPLAMSMFISPHAFGASTLRQTSGVINVAGVGNVSARSSGSPVAQAQPRLASPTFRPASPTSLPVLVPTASPTSLPATDTALPATDTALPPTNTVLPPTDTSLPATATDLPATDTALPASATSSSLSKATATASSPTASKPTVSATASKPGSMATLSTATATRIAPTVTGIVQAAAQAASATPVPPTASKVAPTATSVPATATPLPATATPLPPTNTPPAATVTPKPKPASPVDSGGIWTPDLNELSNTIDAGSTGDRQFRVLGFVYRKYGLPPSSFILTRYITPHCAAEARALGIILTAANADSFADDQWVWVTGTVGSVTLDGKDVPAIKAVNIQPTNEPDDPYIIY